MVLQTGSPQRTWGRLQCGEFRAGVFRFTPTHVGKTRAWRESSEQPSVHPHARGEDEAAVEKADAAYGSPPRTWGRRSEYTVDGCTTRFTPTHVGKTLADWPFS